MQIHGLVDLQVNGFAGADFNRQRLEPESFDRAIAAMVATGVTPCLAILITASADVFASRFTTLDLAVTHNRLGPRIGPGYNLEGPFLNPADRYADCHPSEVMIAPNAELAFRLEAGLSRPILLITIAPELPDGERFIKAMRAAGKMVAIGHATAVESAVLAGARLSTHLGNGIPQILAKLDNTILAQLAHDGLHASFIGSVASLRLASEGAKRDWQ